MLIQNRRTVIQTTQLYRYLGVRLNEFLEDKTMISEALNKGRKALYEVIRMKKTNRTDRI